MSEQIAPGLYYGMSNEEYHASEGVSKSGLDLVSKSPAHYFARYLDDKRPPADDDQSVAQQNGELAHCAILEPGEFSKRFVVGPDVRRNTKKWTEFEATLPAGKSAIKPAQYAAAWAQAASVNRIPDIANALARGKPEVSAYWIDETFVLCKCRPDFVHDCGAAGVILVDVKTCGDARPAEFARMIAKHRYHVQAAYYSDGFEAASGRKVLGFQFASVEMEYPYAASSIMIDEDSIEQGRRDYRRQLDIYAECKAAGVWPGYGTETHLARLPNYAFDREEELEISFI